jgi:hypothetical protein
MEWPPDIKQVVLHTNSKQGGHHTNSDLELAGLLILLLVMEDECDIMPGTHITLFSNNSPTVSWVQRMAAQGSPLAGQLICAQALWLKVRQVSPLTPLHIPGKDNALTDILSWLFGSEPKWFCRTDTDFLTLFNTMSPLPSQNLWKTYHILPACIYE